MDNAIVKLTAPDMPDKTVRPYKVNNTRYDYRFDNWAPDGDYTITLTADFPEIGLIVDDITNTDYRPPLMATNTPIAITGDNLNYTVAIPITNPSFNNLPLFTIPWRP
jgi:hypothetical protein